MLKSRPFLVFSILLFSSLSAQAQDPFEAERLFSPSVAQRFYEIAYELANEIENSDSDPILQKDRKMETHSTERTEKEKLNATRYTLHANKTEQAIMFLIAAINLDNRANYVLPDMIKLTSRHSNRDYSEMVYNLLANYVDESADLEVAKEAVRYLLERLNSREQREKLLQDLLRDLGGKNACLDSELATLLGLLMAEKADFKTAQFHLMQAYDRNKYNKLAFEKLAELAPEQLEPAMHLEHLRLTLGENPTALETAFTFAQYAQRLQLYETAMRAYEYCAELFSFLHPSEALPVSLYLPWSISSYNTERSQHRCLQIASELRQRGVFDLVLEAVAGKAAAKTGLLSRCHIKF